MIVAAAVCPAAPWLLPGVAPRLAERAAGIATAATAAVATLAEVDGIVVVLPPPARRAGSPPVDQTDHDRTATGGEGALPPPGTARVGVSRRDRSQGPLVAVAPAVAAELLARAGVDRPIQVVTATDGSIPPPAAVDDASRTGLLVLADGAAAHGPSAPGREDPRSAELDRRLGDALAAGRPDRLATATAPTADPSPTDLLARIEGLRLLAAWTADRPPQQSSLVACAAPFGVGYLVATWTWSAAQENRAAGGQ